jgi:hypothetical protein
VVGDLVFTVHQYGESGGLPLSPPFILPFWHVFEVVCPTEDFAIIFHCSPAAADALVGYQTTQKKKNISGMYDRAKIYSDFQEDESFVLNQNR